jgi:hypothetical protein
MYVTYRMTEKKKQQRGPPFISDPPVIIFRDFVVGEKMNNPFTLTNASFARNTYKVQGFDQKYNGLFQLNFSPPGFVSPGVSVSLSLDFTPKFNSEIHCAIHSQLLPPAVDGLGYGFTNLPIPVLSRTEVMLKRRGSRAPEVYLSDYEFEALFGCKRSDFYVLPEQRRAELLDAVFQ